jgi:hypothetical protein
VVKGAIDKQSAGNVVFFIERSIEIEAVLKWKRSFPCWIALNIVCTSRLSARDVTGRLP